MMMMMMMMMMFVVCGGESSSSSKVRVMTYNIRTASEWAKVSGGDYPTRTWNRRIKSVARTIMIAKPHVVGTQEGLGNQLDELEHYLSNEYKQYKGVGRLGGLENDDDNEVRSEIFEHTFFLMLYNNPHTYTVCISILQC